MTDARKKERAAAPAMNAGLVETAIRRHVDHRANLLIPEAAVRYRSGTHVDWKGAAHPQFSDYRADFMLVTKAGYGTELEVKVSRGDWKADLAKPKWAAMPEWITRFIYVVPADLDIPEFVPPSAGVWHVLPDRMRRQYPTPHEVVDGLCIQVVRAPHVLGREKVPQPVIDRWMQSFYYRYWDQRTHVFARVPQAIREGVV